MTNECSPNRMWTDRSVRCEERDEMENGFEKKTRCCSEEANLARREEILETATALFAEQGFSDAVTQALAERLGVGKGTIYRHFPSKRALFLAATDRVMRKLQEQRQRQRGGDRGRPGADRAGGRDLPAVLRRPSVVRRAADPGAGVFQGPQAADLFRAPRGEHPALAPALPRPDGRGADPRDAGRADHDGAQQRALRDHGHELLQRPAHAGGRAGQGDPRHHLPGHPDASRNAVAARARAAARRTGRCAETSDNGGSGDSGGELFGGANDHEATMVDAPVGAVAGGDGDRLSAGPVRAGADDPDRRL